MSIATDLLTSHIGKIVKLSFCEARYLAISEAQIAFWMRCIHIFCNIVRTTKITGNTEFEKKQSFREVIF